MKGKLGSLGTIPEEYDVAITTACSQLTHMVVDKVEQGQACIEYLRSRNIGRASFMVLEKLGRPPGMAPLPTPEKAPRLFDLVEIKEDRFAPAFYKALGDTLVAKDIDQANRIAYGKKRWRVVTLAGEMFETSGTMGGGGKPMRGGMSSKFAKDSVSAETLRSYQKESEDAILALEEAQRAAGRAEEELESVRASGPKLDMAYEKLEMDIATGTRRIEDAEKRVRELQ